MLQLPNRQRRYPLLPTFTACFTWRSVWKKKNTSGLTHLFNNISETPMHSDSLNFEPQPKCTNQFHILSLKIISQNLPSLLNDSKGKVGVLVSLLLSNQTEKQHLANKHPSQLHCPIANVKSTAIFTGQNKSESMMLGFLVFRMYFLGSLIKWRIRDSSAVLVTQQ